MCGPMALMGASLGAAALGGIMSAFGQIQAGQAQNKADQYQAAAGVQQALSVNQASRINEQQTYREGDQLAGRALAAQGANGVQVGSGTALQTREDIANRTQANVANQTYNASLATWGAQTQGDLLKAEGAQAQAAGEIGAAGTLLSTAGQVSGKWAAFGG